MIAIPAIRRRLNHASPANWKRFFSFHRKAARPDKPRRSICRTSMSSIPSVHDRLEEKSAENRIIAGVADTAVIGQNVYLFCASEGLACVIRGLVPREKLAKHLDLRSSQIIYLAQTVGYPKI